MFHGENTLGGQLAIMYLTVYKIANRDGIQNDFKIRLKDV